MKYVWLLLFVASSVFAAESPVFSGPQVGERMPPFKAKIVFGENAGDEVTLMDGEKLSPTLLVFVHQISRPAIGLTRLVVEYAAKKKPRGLETEVVFLTKDPTEMEAWMRRAQHALPQGVRPLVSVDGAEGPGIYGLNRHTAVTILVGKEGKVTANFSLGQPSINVDGPKVGAAIAKLLGEEKTPTLADMGGGRGRGMMSQQRAMQARLDDAYRGLMAPVIQKTATQEEVHAAAKKVEESAARNPQMKKRVGNAAGMIVNSGKLPNYGTPVAQEYLRKWAVEFATVEEAETNDNADAPRQVPSRQTGTESSLPAEGDAPKAQGDVQPQASNESTRS